MFKFIYFRNINWQASASFVIAAMHRLNCDYVFSYIGKFAEYNEMVFKN